MKLKKTLPILLILFTQFISAQCGETANVWNNSWKSCTTSLSPNTTRGSSHWLLYEFDEAKIIDSLHIWNANKTGESQLGVKDIIIDYSVDGESWTELGDYIVPQGDETENYDGYDEIALGGILVKKILLTCATSYDTSSNDCISLAEVQFKTVDEDDVLNNDDNEAEINDIEEEIANSLLTIYPNPFTDLITVTNAQNASLEVFDITGKLLFNKVVTEDEELIDLSHLASGVYYIITVLEDSTYASKIVKN